MNRIKILPPGLIAKIAAGQVVERPANVVKELVENALDAHATQINIEIEKAGKKKVVVSDNGFGMSFDDLQLSFLHHTTSKIVSSDDLLAIRTFGFRGEALSSMTAIAAVRIESKQEGQLGGKFVEVAQSQLKKTGSVGMPVGTRVVITGLFSEMPARRKFLKSETTEFSHVLQKITELALANTTVGFTVLHNGKKILELPQNQPVLERVAQLLSQHIADNFLPIEVSNDHFTAEGYIGKPQIGTQSKQRQFLFVNNRSVYNREFSQRLKDVFSTLLEPRSFPAFIISIQLNPELIDVNVDPQKTSVRFLIEQELLDSFGNSVKQVLDAANLTYVERGENGFYEEYTMDATIAKMLRSNVDSWNIKGAELQTDTEILQVHELYLVAQTKRGILIVDQHAAHERILYQEFLEKFESKRNEILHLKVPIQFTLPVAEAKFLLTQLDELKNLGFKVEQKELFLSQSSLNKKINSEKLILTKPKSNILSPKNVSNYSESEFIVTQIPKVFSNRNILRMIQELLHDYISDKQPTLDVGTHRTIAYLACRTAIKAGEKLTQQERKRLLEKLVNTKGKYTCPHGRPVEVELSKQYLDQLFKRIK